MPHHHIHIHDGTSTRDAYAPGKNPASHGRRSGRLELEHSTGATVYNPNAEPRARMPKSVPSNWGSFHRGHDPHVERPDGGYGAHVFEFPTSAHQNRFLNEVGGAPHPLGGKRVILHDAAYAPGKNPASHGGSAGIATGIGEPAHPGIHQVALQHGFGHWGTQGTARKTSGYADPQKGSIRAQQSGNWQHFGPGQYTPSGSGNGERSLREHLASYGSGEPHVGPTRFTRYMHRGNDAYAPGKNPASHPRVAQHHEFLTSQGFKATNHPPRPGTSPVYKHPEGHEVSVHPQTGEFTYYYGKGGRRSDVNRGGTTHPALRAAHEQRNRVRIPGHRYTS